MFSIKCEFSSSMCILARVGKCHGYIRVKKLASWGEKFGGQNNWQKQAIFGKIFAKNLRSMDKLP